MRPKTLLTATLLSLAIAWTRYVAAASGPPATYVAPNGVPLAPPVYLVNFLLLYFANPELAGYLPAYRTPLPQELYQCLFDTPENSCPYDFAAPLLAEQATESVDSGNKDAAWPSSCQTDPRWRALAPPQYRSPDQINAPLGASKAARIAKALRMDQGMILTEPEYQCLITGDDPSRDIIRACFADLTNSTGNSTTPLSSYGLYIDDLGSVRSLCAPDAPCLEGNKVFAGPLEAIAKACGFENKLERLVSRTPIVEFIEQGGDCQHAWFDACIAETECPGNGVDSNNTCAVSLKNP